MRGIRKKSKTFFLDSREGEEKSKKRKERYEGGGERGGRKKSQNELENRHSNSEFYFPMCQERLDGKQAIEMEKSRGAVKAPGEQRRFKKFSSSFTQMRLRKFVDALKRDSLRVRNN